MTTALELHALPPPGSTRASNLVGVTALTAVAPAVWGTTYYATTELLPAGHPMFAGLMRALPVGIIALFIARKLPRGAWWWKAAVLGTLNIGVFFHKKLGVNDGSREQNAAKIHRVD